MSVTHEVKIGREKAWIKVGVSLDLDLHETVASGIDRATDQVNAKMIEAIEKTVSTVEEYEVSK